MKTEKSRELVAELKREVRAATRARAERVSVKRAPLILLLQDLDRLESRERFEERRADEAEARLRENETKIAALELALRDAKIGELQAKLELRERLAT